MRSHKVRSEGQDLTLTAARSEVEAHSERQESARKTGEQEVDLALRDQDQHAKEVVSAFLEAASAIRPVCLTEKRLVERMQRRFGGIKVIWNDVAMEGHRIYAYETSLELLDQREVYVLTSGQVVYRERKSEEPSAEFRNQGLPGHAHVEVHECFGGSEHTWNRTADTLDGRLPFHVDRLGQPSPGRVSMHSTKATERIEDIERTTTWLIRTLAAYLQSSGGSLK